MLRWCQADVSMYAAHMTWWHRLHIGVRHKALCCTATVARRPSVGAFVNQQGLINLPPRSQASLWRDGRARVHSFRGFIALVCVNSHMALSTRP